MPQTPTTGPAGLPPAGSSPDEQLQRDALALIDPLPGAFVAYAVEMISTGRAVSFHGDERFHPASTIKTPLLVTLFKAADSGKLKLDDRLPIHNGFPSSMDASIFDLSADDDSEKSLYTRMGQPETLLELARLMIVRSSNLATNLLMEVVPPASVSEYMTVIGCGDLYLRNRMMDLKAFAALQTNRATAQGLTKLKVLLAQKKLPGSDQIIDILLQQELDKGVLTALPPGSKFAHKTGSITAHFHDSGIVYPADNTPPYALTILTRGIPDEKTASQLVTDLTRLFHTWARQVGS